jgi:predicted helicase
LRWASDRIGDEGIVALVTNNGYLEAINADGVRQHLAADFDAIYLVNLGGNVRKNPKLSGTTHNVFGIQVGVSIALFVRRRQKELKLRRAIIRYAAVGANCRKEEKWAWLEKNRAITGVKWQTLKPDAKSNWLREGLSDEFDKFLPMGTKETKALDSMDSGALFRTYSLGASTNRDAVVYDFDHGRLKRRVEIFCDQYNAEVARFQQKRPPVSTLDEFLKRDQIKWSRNLKSELKRIRFVTYDSSCIRETLYRPFTKKRLYFGEILVDEPGQNFRFFPRERQSNPTLFVPTSGARADFWAFAGNCVANLNLMSLDAAQCFPLHTYDADGGHRRDNVTDWALAQFKTRYPDGKLSKRDIFHYVYAVLHHPAYREKYAANLRRELPRIPFAPDFAAFARAGEKLATLHTGYEAQKEFKLTRVETKGARPDWRVERMKLSKDKTELVYNGWLTLTGIPPEAQAYRLGNRSALEWVVDQYRVERAKDNPDEIVSDPNRADDEEYIVRLIGQVVTVSVETMALVRGLPPLSGDPGAPAASPAFDHPDLSYEQAAAAAAHFHMVGEDAPPAG